MEKIKILILGSSVIKNESLIKIKTRRILKIQVNNINIYNVLSSIALLKELNLDINKIIKSFKNYEQLKEEERFT